MRTLRASGLVAALPFRSLARKLRPTGLANGLVAIPILNALVLGGLYMTVDGHPLDVHRLAMQWPYFVASTAFVAGVASWEIELLSGMLGAYAGRASAAVLSRLVYVVAATSPIVALFLTLLAIAAEPGLLNALLAMIIVIVGFSSLGSGIALNLGFGSDKGINNLAQLTPWLFALGHSPFFPAGVPYVQWLFPPSGAEISLRYEFARAVILLALAWLLTHRALGVRRAPTYQP